MNAIDATELRRQRGLQIAAVCRIDEKHGFYIVPSQSGQGGRYWVKPDEPHCTCPDFEERGKPCKHIYAVEFYRQRERNADGSETITTTVVTKERVKYSQVWPAYNAAQANEKEKFQALLRDLCRGIPEPKHVKGRRPMPLSDAVFCAAMKVYTTVSGRRCSCDLKDAEAKGYIARAPHYNSVFNYLENPDLTPILKRLIVESARPLAAVEVDFAVDSSGFTTSRFVRWYDAKYGAVKQEHDWVKVHLMCGVKTNVVTAVEIEDRRAGDCPMFAPLVNATAGSFRLGEVSGDAAYASYENMELVAKHGGTPFIAFRSNATAAKGGVYEKMYHYFCLNRDDFLDHYHKRSNVESTFSMVKAKFGDHVRSKADTAMVNEALCKILCHNLCCLIQALYELGIEPTFWTASSEGVTPQATA